MIRLTLLLMLLCPGTALLCMAHEVDWKTEAGNSKGETTQAGRVSQLVYLVCDVEREERADEIVRTRFASVYDQYVATGDIISWGWLSHDTESQYRRLLKVNASDWNKLLAARESISGAIGKTEGVEEFTEICNSFTENLIDIEQDHH